MRKNRKYADTLDDEIPDEEIPLQPPEPEYISAKFKLNIPINDPHFDEPWELRKYAAKLIERKIGDEVQVTDLKVKMPGLLRRIYYLVTRKTPEARIYLTVKF